MKKILTAMLCLLALPASATFYQGKDSYSDGRWDRGADRDERKGAQKRGAAGHDNGDAFEIDFGKYKSSSRSWQGAAPPVENPQQAWEAYERRKHAEATKRARKKSRNTAYGGSRGHGFAGSDGSGSKGSSGSKG